MAEKISQLPAASALDGTEAVPVVQAGATAQAAAGAFLPPDYISGLKMVWNSANSLSVTSGAAFVDSLGRVMRSSGTLTLSGLSLAASTWYHVYLYNNGGTPAIECVTTAPDAPYFGSARTKTGDTSRRYLGSVRTNSAGVLMKFGHTPATGDILYYESLNDSELHVLHNGAATSYTTISLSSGVPATSKTTYIFAESGIPSGGPDALVSNSEIALQPGGDQIIFFCRSGTKPFGFKVPTDSSQSLRYLLDGTPTSGGLDIWISGYTYER